MFKYKILTFFHFFQKRYFHTIVFCFLIIVTLLCKSISAHFGDEGDNYKNAVMTDIPTSHYICKCKKAGQFYKQPSNASFPSSNISQNPKAVEIPLLTPYTLYFLACVRNLWSAHIIPVTSST